MNDHAIFLLTRAERRSIKQMIKIRKKEKESFLKQQEQQEQKEKFQEELMQNKEERKQCLEAYRKRKIKESIFETQMKEYEKEGYELELKITQIEQERIKESFYLKRLNILLLLFGFLDGIEKMVITDQTGQKRCLSLNDMVVTFLDIVLEEEKETLEKEHRILQLYMLLNSVKEQPLDKKHPFYLTEEEKIKTYSQILEMEEKRKVRDKKRNINHLPSLEDLKLNDFFSTNIEEIYKHLFEEAQEQKRKKQNR